REILRLSLFIHTTLSTISSLSLHDALPICLVYVNDKSLDENYILPEFLDHRTYPPVYVEPGHYYVLGDHRNQSNDSRMWGLVPEDRKSTRLNSSHLGTSYAVFCL